MSAANARLERVVGHRVAAVLDDDDLAVELLEPRQRLGEHRAPWCGGRRRCHDDVRRVLFDVRVRQVGGADGRLAATDAEVDGDVDVGAGQVDLARTRRADAVDADRRAVERHGDPIRIQLDRRHPDGGQHPAPVRVGAEQRGLDQAVAGDDAGGDQRVVLAGGAGDGDGDPLGDALGVGLQLRAQVVADREHGGVEFVLARRDLAGAGGQQQHGVVGRAAAVDVEPVEGPRGGLAQRAVERVGVGDGVGGDDAQHGRQRRRQHARALRHAADGPVVRVVQRNLLRARCRWS